MQVKLIVVEGQARQREVVRELPLVIGRSRAAGVTVGDPKVSRQHCFLEELGGMVMLRDNGSLNGTLLDGQRVEGQAVIQPGAKLTVGPLTFVVIYEPTGEGVQGDTGQMSPEAADEPDFETLLGGGDEADEEEAAAFDEPGDADAEEEAAAPSADDATAQWLPPAADESPSFLPPPAASASPATPTSPKRTDKAAAVSPPQRTEFDFLASLAADDDDGESPAETADEAASSAADDDVSSGAADAASTSAAESGDDNAELPESTQPAPDPAPQPKRSWWPFGKKRKPARPAKNASQEAEPSAAAAESADQASPEEQPPSDETIGPPADTLAGESRPFLPQAPEAGSQQAQASTSGADDEPADPVSDDDDLNQFLKGLR